MLSIASLKYYVLKKIEKMIASTPQKSRKDLDIILTAFADIHTDDTVVWIVK